MARGGYGETGIGPANGSELRHCCGYCWYLYYCTSEEKGRGCG